MLMLSCVRICVQSAQFTLFLITRQSLGELKTEQMVGHKKKAPNILYLKRVEKQKHSNESRQYVNKIIELQ